MTLEGRTALVTGSSRNMGKAIALEFARQGADVAVCARSSAAEADAVAQQVRQMGRRAVTVFADLAKRDDVLRMVAEAVQGLGKIDILVNTPAVRPHQKFLDITEHDWEYVMDVNLKAAFWASQAVIPGMVERKWGRIMHFSGSLIQLSTGGAAHIMASKLGLVGLTRSLAIEFARDGITVNTIVPGTFDTQRTPEWDLAGRKVPANIRTGWVPGNPVDRLGRLEEMGALCAFVASDSAAFITGQSLHINGGMFLS